MNNLTHDNSNIREQSNILEIFNLLQRNVRTFYKENG